MGRRWGELQKLNNKSWIIPLQQWNQIRIIIRPHRRIRIRHKMPVLLLH